MLRDRLFVTLAPIYSTLDGVYCDKVALTDHLPSGETSHAEQLSPTCFDHSGSLRCGRLSLRPHVAIANFFLVQPKSAGGETLFSAKLSSVESPLSALFTGVFKFLLPPPATGLCQIKLSSPICTGSKTVISIQEATVYMRLDAAGVPHWFNLLEVGATHAS